MNVLISSALNPYPRTISSKYILLLLLSVIGLTLVQAQCNPNVALTQTGTTCLGSDTLILTGTDSVIQITWYNDTNIVSTGTDTFYVPATAGIYHAIVATGSCADTTTGIMISPLVTPSVSISASPGDTVCANTPVMFTTTITNGGNTPLYKWTKNNIVVGTDSIYTDSIPVNGDAVVVLLTSNATCRTQDTISSNTVSLTVDTLPTATIAVSGSLHRCIGDSVKLTAPAGDTYLWSTGDTSRIIHGHAAGGYDVTVTNGYGCTAMSKIDTLVLTPTVQPTIGISADLGNTICLNTAVTFTATVTNGGTHPSYLWKKNNIYVGNSATYIGNPLVDGDVVTCILTSNATCASPKKDTSAPITMTVYALPVVSISGTAHICGNDSAQLTASVQATSYLWSTGATTASIATAASGYYAVTVTDQNNCSAGSLPVIVTTSSTQVPSIIQSGSSLSTETSQFYQWYFNGNIIDNATTQDVGVSHSGFYQVAVIDSFGCRSISAIDPILLTGIDDIALISGMKVYPNPSTGAFNMNWADETARDLRILDAIGNVITDDKSVTARSRQYNLSNVASGIYYVQVSQGTLTKTMKLSIVR